MVCCLLLTSFTVVKAQNGTTLRQWPVGVKQAQGMKKELMNLNDRISEKLGQLQNAVESQAPLSIDSLMALSKAAKTDSIEPDSLNIEEISYVPVVRDSAVLQMAIDSLKAKTEFLMGQKEVIELNKELGELEQELTILQSQEKLLEQLKSQMDSGQLKALKGQIDEMDQLMQEYKSMLKEYTNKLDGWDNEIEDFVLNHKEIKALREEYQNQKILEHSLQDRSMEALPMQTKEGVKDGVFKQIGGEPEEARAMVLEKIEEATGLLSKAKEKYAELSDIPQVNTQAKNPLKGVPLKYRFVYGGNMSVNQGNPASIDLTVDLGYRLSPKFTLGSGLIYRSNLGSGFKDIQLGTLGWGYRSFIDYNFLKQFFMEGAFESYYGDVSAKPKNTNQEEEITNDKLKAGLLGLGYRYKLKGKVKGKFLVLYNLTNQSKNQFGNPIVFRMGIEF